ncbi:MAG: hypothetical protein R2727_05455 [Bacteroidales bacterium]
MTLKYKPGFHKNEAADISAKIFGINGVASILPGERDQNFLIETVEGSRFILKIASSRESPGGYRCTGGDA